MSFYLLRKKQSLHTLVTYILLCNKRIKQKNSKVKHKKTNKNGYFYYFYDYYY